MIEPFDKLPTTAFRKISCDISDLVFRQGTATNGVFFIETGEINLRRMTEAGHEVTIHRATAGQLFAEASLFSDVYHCDAVCMKAGHVIRMNKVDVLHHMKSDAAFALAVTKLLAGQIQSYRQTLEILNIRAARDRVLAAIAAGYLDGPIMAFASRIGLSHEVCYRMLRLLCDEGVLCKTKRGQYLLVEIGQKTRP